MKYIKTYKLFENLESKIDLQELDGLLIDFKQMGLETNIKVGSTSVLDFDKLNKEINNTKLFQKQNPMQTVFTPKPLISSSDLGKYTKSSSWNSISIEFISRDPEDYNIDEVSEAYDMLKSYLYDNYDFIPNYIYINYHWSYYYFENFERIKEYKNMAKANPRTYVGSTDKNYFKAHNVIFGFYEDPDAVFRGPEF
jgi:hypothetical protein